MKKLKYLIITLFSLLFIPCAVKAANATVSIEASNQVVVGKKITVTVKLSSPAPIGSWEMQLNYDKSYLQLTSSNAEGGGNYMVNATTSKDGVKSKSYTFTFKALKSGSANLSIGSLLVYDNNMAEMNVSTSPKSIKIITEEQLENSYSKDNYLKSLSVEGYELTPTFSQNTLDYTVNVSEGTTKVNIVATPNDSKARVTGAGEVEVTEGSNTKNIVVRAENGSERTYTIFINVADQDPINVTIDNENYTVVKLRSNYECPQLYMEKEIMIDGRKVPACYNEKIDFTLVGLKKSDGTVASYQYLDGKYIKYLEVTGTSLKLIIIDNALADNSDGKGMNKYQEEIDGNTYTVLKTKPDSTNYVVYALNVETGEKDFYNYDSIHKTFTLYDDSALDNITKLNKTYLYIIIIFAILLVLAIIMLICKWQKSSKKTPLKSEVKKEDTKKKKDKKREEKEKAEIKERVIKEDINEVKEVVNKDEEDETKEFYDIFEDDKKKKKK